MNKLKATNAIEALASHAGCDPSDIEKEDYGYYGLELFSVDKAQYAVGTDEEVKDALVEYVKETAWAFRSSFICEYCNLPQEMAEALEIMQSKKCESANESILALIEKTEGGVEGFAEEAERWDGRGHLLASYDGAEGEESGFFIYRIQ